MNLAFIKLARATRLPILVGAAAALIASLAGLPAADAEPKALVSSYNVSLIGLPVGRAGFDTSIDGDRYTVKGTLSSVGLADIFATTSGKSEVSGTISNGRLFAQRYALNYSSDKKTYSSAVAMQLGSVTSAEVAPKADQKKEGYIPVMQDQLKSVVDPLSGLMIMGKASPDSLCNRTIPFYDGWSRLDLLLSPGGTRSFSTDGYKGEVVVCKVRVSPVSGYRPTSHGMRYIARQTLELWFAPIKDTGIFAPVYARIPTEIGPLTLRASVFAKN